MDLRQELGRIDIYFLDQVLRGNVPLGSVVLDAGCGGGRNLHALMKWGYEVYGSDQDSNAIERVQALAKQLNYEHLDRFQVEKIEELSAADGSIDVVLANAVLHFARDPEHFRAMVLQLHRVLKPGGLAFCRLASNIGIEDQVVPLDSNAKPRVGSTAKAPAWFELPDKSHRYLVDLETLLAYTSELKLELVDPIKTVNVQGIRCMTNWVWRK